MPKVCEHNIPETLKGVGPCRISSEVKLRSGRPNWWCRTHGSPAGAPDGAALERCPASWFETVPTDQRVELDAAHGEFAVWGVVAPALTLGDPPIEAGKVHVHRRPSAGDEKDLDESYDIVTLKFRGREFVIEGMAAVAFSTSALAGRPVRPLVCHWCGGAHIDEMMFSTHPHRKHLCNSCGRNFSDASGPSISNPLADVYTDLELHRPREPKRTERSIELKRTEYSAIAIWPSNPAIISTMSRPEDEGIHVHAWDHSSTLVIDETFSPVTIDGVAVDEAALRALAVQRTLAHDAPVVSVPCGHCGSTFVSPTEGWIQPRTKHVCPSCGETTRTRRRVFLNPLAEKP